MKRVSQIFNFLIFLVQSVENDEIINSKTSLRMQNERMETSENTWKYKYEYRDRVAAEWINCQYTT